VADVVGIVFPNGTKSYYFDPAGLELARGDRVVVQTANGPEIGQVVEPNHTIEDSELPAPLKKVTRLATGKDLEAQAASQTLRKQALITCREMIASHGLDMKLVGADISFGGEKITFSFYAEERVDFRSLVADLAKALKTRIELRQVGAREEARMVGGLGPCGRSLCCTLFPPGDEPVSIRMAKEQNLPLNPAKISGLCGRLMCCLKYEQEQYVRFRKEAPPKGTPVHTPGGPGAVVGYNVLKDAITVRLEDGHTTDIKVRCCQCQEDGGLVVVPELGEPASPPELLGAAGGLVSVPDTDTDAEDEEELAIIEAEVVLGEDGEPVEIVVAEGSRRRRRGRGRRGGRGRPKMPGEGGDEGEASAAAGPRPSMPAGATDAGRGAKTGPESGGVRHQSQHGQRHPERHRGGVPGHRIEGGAPAGQEPRHRQAPAGGGQGGPAGSPGAGGAAGGPGAGEEGAGTGTSASARRRRRRRRPSGGNGGNGGDAGGAGGGSAPGGAPGGD
jgi:cell fate regulator YaaT (PSP1 superfamily)